MEHLTAALGPTWSLVLVRYAGPFVLTTLATALLISCVLNAYSDYFQDYKKQGTWILYESMTTCSTEWAERVYFLIVLGTALAFFAPAAAFREYVCPAVVPPATLLGQVFALRPFTRDFAGGYWGGSFWDGLKKASWFVLILSLSLEAYLLAVAFLSASHVFLKFYQRSFAGRPYQHPSGWIAPDAWWANTKLTTGGMFSATFRRSLVVGFVAAPVCLAVGWLLPWAGLALLAGVVAGGASGTAHFLRRFRNYDEPRPNPNRIARGFACGWAIPLALASPAVVILVRLALRRVGAGIPTTIWTLP